MNNDLENTIYWLEKFWDLEKNKKLKEEYYFLALNKIAEYNKRDIFSLKAMSRLMNKLNLEEIEINSQNWIFLETQENLYITLIQNWEISYLLNLANLYEEEWDIFEAFNKYLQAFQIKINNSKDALAMFLETSLKDFIKKDYDNNISIINSKTKNKEEQKINQELLKRNKEEFEIKNELLRKILEKIDNNEILLREDIATLFDMSLWDRFYEKNISPEIINNFIEAYKLEINFLKQNPNLITNNDIYLHRLLENSFGIYWVNMKNSEVENLLKKIYSKKELKEYDKELIFKLLDLETNQEDPFKYTKLLDELWKESIQE